MGRNWKIITLAFTLIFCVAIISYIAKPHLFSALLRYLPIDDPSYYDPYIRAVSKRHGVDFHLVKAVIKAESRFDCRAVSAKGAIGLMQMMPVTVDHMGVSDPFNPKENIEGGVRYLKRLLKIFDNDVKLALAAYNAGPTTVKRYGGVPPYKETRAYLKKVLRFYSEYKNNT